MVWLAVSAGACTGWQTVQVSPEQLVAEQHPNKVRVTRQDGSRIEVEDPTVAEDTLLGTIQPVTVTTRESTGHGEFTPVIRTVGVDTITRAAIPIADITRVERRHVSAGKTAGLVAGILALGAVVAGGIALAGWDCCLGTWGQ
jgi:hypothetical protein